ncbi:hypothetical protein H0H81_000723, partial [Sphagnurus paluster]
SEGTPENQDIPQPQLADFSLQPLAISTSIKNSFGLYQRFITGIPPPSEDPEENLDIRDLRDAAPPRSMQEPFFPYPNKSSFHLGEWYWNNGHQKSLANFQALVMIIRDPTFKAADITKTRWSEINNILGTHVGDFNDAEWLDMDEGWRSTPIVIQVPFHNRTKAPGILSYCVGDLYHRSITAVIRERLTGSSQGLFVYYPYKLLWEPSDAEHSGVRVYGELYTSPAFVESYKALLNSPPEPGCSAPQAIIGLMFWSDATHLTSFGQVQLWPAYMFFGNNSKYDRCSPTSNLASHIAYFQKLPDAFKDLASDCLGGKGPI